jgi:hypothetical protein
VYNHVLKYCLPHLHFGLLLRMYYFFSELLFQKE